MSFIKSITLTDILVISIILSIGLIFIGRWQRKADKEKGDNDFDESDCY